MFGANTYVTGAEAFAFGADTYKTAANTNGFRANTYRIGAVLYKTGANTNKTGAETYVFGANTYETGADTNGIGAKAFESGAFTAGCFGQFFLVFYNPKQVKKDLLPIFHFLTETLQCFPQSFVFVLVYLLRKFASAVFPQCSRKGASVNLTIFSSHFQYFITI